MGKTSVKWLLILFILLSGIPAYSQSLPANGEAAANDTAEMVAERPVEKGDLWISPGFETAMYNNFLIGGSLTLGYGRGASIGIKAVYYPEQERISILELAFLLRFYLRGTGAYSGPFLQMSGGPILIGMDGNFDFPSELGVISAGITFGWRFLFIDRLFIEPSIRGGYPYMFGAGLSGGIRF